MGSIDNDSVLVVLVPNKRQALICYEASTVYYNVDLE